MSILVTGGAGFIGSHTCVELLNAGYDVVVVDNLYNASPKALDRVKEITGKDLKFYEADIRDREALNEVFDKEEVESVCWLSIDEINSLMNEDKFFKNHYEEFEILLNWLKEG